MSHLTGPARSRAASLRSQWAFWFAVLAAVTVGMLAVRESLDKAHVALGYLLVVLGASSRGGRALGLSVSGVAFLSFNFFFLLPHYTLVIAHPLDWLILFAFLATASVAAQLLARARSEAREAEQRAMEIDRLSSLGAEALNAGRADDALVAVAEMIRTTLGVVRCEIHLRAAGGETVTLAAAAGATLPADEDSVTYAGASLVEWVARSGRRAIVRADGTVRIEAAADTSELPLALADAHTLLVPLRVRDRAVGVLRIAHSATMTLDHAQQRFLTALAYYAALGAERVRLVAEAEDAEVLRQAGQLKDALLASVSHDIRTPLTTIKALAHDLGASGDERAIIIEEEADRLNRFVADLLDLSRITGGALTITPEITPADDLLGATIQRVSGALDGRTLNASIEEGEPLLVGRFDFVHSLRALGNLVDNALKYSPRGGVVDLSARRVNGMLEFAVADRGPGVAPAEQERIFEPFYRPPGTAPDVGGAGLGLSIARRLAEAQAGSVGYEPRDGGGSVFVLRLPAADLADVPDFSTT